MTRLSFRTVRALIVLASFGEHGTGCSNFGAGYFRGERSGHVVANHGGGDYAAQMMLGRLRKQGLVRVANGPGSSTWELTWEGKKVVQYWGAM